MYGGQAAGRGLSGLGQMLMGLQQRRDADAEREAELAREMPFREAQRAAMLSREGLIEGNRPTTVTLPDEPAFRVPSDPTAPKGGGLGISASAPEPSRLSPGGFDAPNVTASALAPKVAFTPDSRYEQVTPGYHRMTDEAERQREQATLRSAIGAFLANPDDPNAMAGVAALDLNPGTVRQAASPEPEPRWAPTSLEEYRRAHAPYPKQGGEDGTSDERLRQVGYQVNATKQGLAKLLTGKYAVTQQEVDQYIESIWGTVDAFRRAESLVTGMEPPTREDAPQQSSVMFPGSPSFRDMARSRGVNLNASGSSATAPLSAIDKAAAQQDPEFQEELRKMGYTEADWR